MTYDVPTLREAIIAEEMRWIGATWHHRALVPYQFCDCARIHEGTAKALGLLVPSWQPPIYSSEWHWHNNEDVLTQVLARLGCQRVADAVAQPQALLACCHSGDILVFQYGRVCSHTALLVSQDPAYVVHAMLHTQVTHQRLAGDLLSRLRQAYTFPGVVP